MNDSPGSEPARFLWFLPMDVDVAVVGTWPPEGARPTVERLVSITRAAEDAGFEGLLVPTSYHNPLDPISSASAVLAGTDTAYLLLAIRPNQYHPAQAAKLLAGLCDLFPGRVRINVTTGGWDEDRWIGNDDDRPQRERRLVEWLELLTAVLNGTRPVHYRGEFYYSDGARLRNPLPAPLPIAMSGSSPGARAALARFGHEYLMYAAPLPDVTAEVTALRSTPGCERTLVTMRAHVVVRETEELARSAAAEIVSRIDPRVSRILAAQQRGGPGQRGRQNALAAGEEEFVAPNLWTGVGKGRFGVAVTLVGDPEQVADRLQEYRDAGVSGFILSGYPKLSEAERFGRLLTPVLTKRGLM
jgi:alkanesulfonate monooxygenase